ncbi:DUF3667 domain-containing protein [Flavobacterium sp. IB48]|uniref:DUF3667 domain-containing protein n=1 Tax=Flavobacterium sp. IB48 TaxID=2779375 RepID=UPI0018E7028B|nr:DUF3667 domain-containing protein [Flavobacterium sp. IB48]MBJ2124119.1 DUF3667 domain-containing protein [Flavobacterium sp. IB48]
MEIICKNCHQIFKGHYCNNCGQAAETHKINAHFLWHDIQHGLLHFDKGILYSLKQLFTRPGHSIREFIEGKRVHHFKPLSLVVVLATLYGLLYHYFHINTFEAAKTSNIDSDYINEWFATHFSWVTVGSIPIYTIGTYLVFRKQGYNFVELFVLNTFKAAQRISVQLVTMPVLIFLNHTSHIAQYNNVMYVIGIILIFWTNMQFFNKMSKIKAFFLTLLSHLIFLICFFLITAIVLLFFGKL